MTEPSLLLLPVLAASISTAAKFGIALLVFVAPLVVSALIARALKIKEHQTRLSVCLFAGCLSVTPFVYQYLRGSAEQAEYREQLAAWETEGKPAGKEPVQPAPRTWRSAFRLGIDLAGGTNMVFQVRFDEKEREDAEKAAAEREQGNDADRMGHRGGTDRSAIMSRLVTAVNKRLNPSGTEELTIRQVGADRIEVIIPGADREVVEAKKKAMTQLGSLEFAVLADTARHESLIQRARGVQRDLRDGGRLVAGWREVGVDPEGRPKRVSGSSDIVRPVMQFGKPKVGSNGEPINELLVVFEDDERRVTGEYLSRAQAAFDKNASPSVSFTFNQRGGYLFQLLTTKYQPSELGNKKFYLAVLLDGKIHSAPSVNEPIGAQGQITGQFTQDEVDELVGVLNAGALEVPIDRAPISEFSVSPLLGADVQEKGLRAIALSAVVVFAFMLVYYRVPGFVADLSLLFNILLIMGSMAFIEATFTLPGLAGIVLVIGMAVDANVLIFERMREETARGSSLRMAVHNGFDRAFTTIVDSNLTTLIVAVVLYVIGTDAVRGFAVTLFVGIVMSMFSAVYLGRLIFEVAERKRWISRLTMMSLVKSPRWDFLGKQKLCFALSGAAIVAGMGVFFSRGSDNLDIDFTGGTMVTFEFVQPHGQDEVRALLQKNEAFGSEITVETLQTLEEAGKVGQGATRFRLRTREQDVAKVRRAVAETLAKEDLFKVTVAPGAPRTLADPGKPPEKPGPDVLVLPAGDIPDGFAQGTAVDLAFSSEIAPTTAAYYFQEALERLGADSGAARYPDAAALFRISGLEGQGTEAAVGAVRKFGTMRLLTVPSLPRADLDAALASMTATMKDEPILDEVNSFASSVAAEMRETALLAMAVSLLAIVAYIWFRFDQVSWGIAAVVALVHDVLFVLGLVSISGLVAGTGIGTALDLYDFKINLPMVAAFLTLVGYSINDTIVVFDRIREVRGKNPAVTNEMVNLSLNQTLSRTLLTAFTTWIVVAVLYALGGEGVHGFAFVLVAGIVVGTYSSIWVASPIVIWLMNREKAAARGAQAARPVAATR